MATTFSGLSEHWTITREGLVVRGSTTTIKALAETLDVPSYDVIQVSPVLAVLGLWGEELSRYNALRSTAYPKSSQP